MVSIFSEAIRNKELPSGEFVEMLNSLAPEVFMPIAEDSTYKACIKEILLYLLHAYSRESAKSLLNTNWNKNKSDIAKLVELPDHVYDDVVMVKSKTVRNVIDEYLTLQADRDYKHLQMNKDLYDRGMSSAFENLDDDEGKMDFKAMKERRAMLSDIYEEIEKLEEKIASRNEVISFNQDELKKLEDAQVDTTIEKSKFLRRN